MSLETDLMALLQPLIGGTVIFMDQSAPRPALPYTAIKIMSVRYVNQDHYSNADANGIQTVKGDREFTLNVQRYQKFDTDNVSIELQTLVDKLRLTTTIDKFMAKKIVAFNTAQVTDISALLDKSQTEKRASLDIFGRYKSTLTDNVGYIDTVVTDASDDSSAGPYVITATVVTG